MGDEAGDGIRPASDDGAQAEDAAGHDAADDDTESYEGLAPPEDEDDGGAGAVLDEGAPETEGTASLEPPATPLPEPPTGWLGSTTPIGAPPPPPPPNRGRRLALIVAVLVLLGAAAGAIFALSGGSSSPEAAPPPSPAPSPSLLPPASLAAQAEPFDVTLTWTQQVSRPAVDTYEIYRNDTLVDEVAGTSTTYDDASVTPGRKYTYKLQAKSGTLVTSPVSIRVTVPKPALARARLEGDFNVKLTVVSSSGFRTIDTKSTAGWQFKPKCKRGPCKVLMSDLSEKSLRLTLDRKGVKYTGDDPSVLFGTCSGKAIPSTSTVEITVTKAKGLTGKWVAARFTGTVSFETPSQLGCVSASATLSLTGSLLG